ncbi:hypothetical protein KKE60_07245 [Patescibacteria group bacterium]|nr:hypothetical protein [Patescibacteria group bacterium]
MSLSKIEEYISFTEEQQVAMQIEMEKQHGLQYLIPIKVVLSRIGNSAGCIIPKTILDYLGFSVGQEVNLYITTRKEEDE